MSERTAGRARLAGYRPAGAHGAAAYGVATHPSKKAGRPMAVSPDGPLPTGGAQLNGVQVDELPDRSAPGAPVSAAIPAPDGGGTQRLDASAEGIDGARFRAVLGRFATGVVAITAVEPGTGLPTGLAANSFTSVSLDPPLVAFCVAHTSSTWPRLRTAERLCVNILSQPQEAVCRQLAAKGTEKFADLEWTESPSGSPVLSGALAWIECSVEQEHVAGDHVIVVARVHHLEEHHEGSPLLFYQGAYGRFHG